MRLPNANRPGRAPSRRHHRHRHLNPAGRAHPATGGNPPSHTLRTRHKATIEGCPGQRAAAGVVAPCRVGGRLGPGIDPLGRNAARGVVGRQRGQRHGGGRAGRGARHGLRGRLRCVRRVRRVVSLPAPNGGGPEAGMPGVVRQAETCASLSASRFGRHTRFGLISRHNAASPGGSIPPGSIFLCLCRVAHRGASLCTGHPCARCARSAIARIAAQCAWVRTHAASLFASLFVQPGQHLTRFGPPEASRIAPRPEGRHSESPILSARWKAIRSCSPGLSSSSGLLRVLLGWTAPSLVRGTRGTQTPVVLPGPPTPPASRLWPTL